MINKLEFIAPSTYNINLKKGFVAQAVAPEYLKASFDFAFNMTFGCVGHHRNHRTGGNAKRKNGEIFINAFQGKVAEFAFYDFTKRNNLDTELPDVSLMGEGLWDNSDFIVNGKKISIKSAAHFSHLMLLETQDWDSNANYIPNIDTGNASYDYFVLIRIKIDGKQLMKDKNLYHADTIDYKSLKRIIATEPWSADFTGFVTKSDLQFVINNQHIIPQGGLLNGKMPMDASNYYFQSGDLRSIDELVHLLI